MKRKNWLEALGHEGASRLSPSMREALAGLDDALFELWGLGENMILAWTREGHDLLFLAVRHYAIVEAITPNPDGGPGASVEAVNTILAGDKFVGLEEFNAMRQTLGKASQVARVPFKEDAVDPGLVSILVTRYGVTLVRDRAVILLDAVGFSLHTPLEQVAMLNSLSYSVNSAYGQLLSKDVRINFARTTTGDGFYIWNRARTVDSNIALYELMLLILTDNAIAQRKSRRFPVPKLRVAFHIGEHYEFYQVEALNPTSFGYIVGQATVELARLLESARPGQILLGDFRVKGVDGSVSARSGYDTIDFVAQTAARVSELRGLRVGGDTIENVRCYLTGPQKAEGAYSVHRYSMVDKHGRAHFVYNAKVNIHCRSAPPLFLGLQHEVLHGDPKADSPWLVI